MNIVFLDTETNGLPKNYKAPIHVLDNWPRVIQLAWEVVDADTQEMKRAGKMLATMWRRAALASLNWFV